AGGRRHRPPPARRCVTRASIGLAPDPRGGVGSARAPLAVARAVRRNGEEAVARAAAAPEFHLLPTRVGDAVIGVPAARGVNVEEADSRGCEARGSDI